jgi:arginine repressor
MVNKSQTTLDKEQKQLALCRALIAGHAYGSQEALRRDLKRHGYRQISQSTVSRLLALLGVIKTRNAKGQKIYILSPQSQAVPHAACRLADMVLSVEANHEFILVQTVAGYGRAVGRVIDQGALPEVLGVVAGSSMVWVAPRHSQTIAQTCRQLCRLLGIG